MSDDEDLKGMDEDGTGIELGNMLGTALGDTIIDSEGELAGDDLKGMEEGATGMELDGEATGVEDD